MQIINHQLYGSDGAKIRSINSPNSRTGLNARYIVQHYTASSSPAAFENVIKRFADPATKVSAHFVIGRDGKIAQCVPLNKVAFHAGDSKWKTINGLNGFSFGIENISWGVLTKKGNKFYSWTGTEVPSIETFQNSKGQWFHTYTREQLEANLDLCKLLCKQYHIVDMIGHEDIAPGRKLDPSESFPMEEFRNILFNRKNYL